MPDRKVILRRLASIAAASTALSLSAASPAFAGQGDVETTCPINNICMWEDIEYGGHKWVEQSARDGKIYDIDWWNGDNAISSIKNTSGLYICVYPGDYAWGGGYIIVAPHEHIPNLVRSHGFDNEAESLKFTDAPTNECT